MANPEHLKILSKGVREWNAWRQQEPGTDPDLEKADLSQIVLLRFDLTGCDLRSAILRGANMQHVSLGGAMLDDADLRETDLRGARLTNGLAFYGGRLEDLGGDPSGAMTGFVNDAIADAAGWKIVEASGVGGRSALPSTFIVQRQEMRRTSLSNACLEGADLRDAVLATSDLTGVSFAGARFGATVLDAELATTAGLDEVEHSSRSYLSLRALSTLPPPFPEPFLKGCGLSDLDIEVARLYQDNLSTSQVTDIGYRIIELKTDPAIQFYSCFISYSSDDDEFAKRLYADLQQNGVRCWFAPEDLKIGDKFRAKIDEAIRSHDKLLLILSKAAIESGWIEYEVGRGHSREMKLKQTILFPVRLDDEILNVDASWTDFIRDERHIGDFSNPDTYDAAFQRLIRDLREEHAQTFPVKPRE